VAKSFGACGRHVTSLERKYFRLWRVYRVYLAPLPSKSLKPNPQIPQSPPAPPPPDRLRTGAPVSHRRTSSSHIEDTALWRHTRRIKAPAPRRRTSPSRAEAPAPRRRSKRRRASVAKTTTSHPSTPEPQQSTPSPPRPTPSVSMGSAAFADHPALLHAPSSSRAGAYSIPRSYHVSTPPSVVIEPLAHLPTPLPYLFLLLSILFSCAWRLDMFVFVCDMLGIQRSFPESSLPLLHLQVLKEIHCW
jgi:hypothetical protein